MSGKYLITVLVTLVVIASMNIHAGENQHLAYKDSVLLEKSKQYSNTMIEKNPVLGELLDKMGFKYLHQLNPKKIYSFNPETKEVKILDSATIQASVGSMFGFGTPTAKISSSGSQILGEGRTVVTCPLGSQTAEVNGFMASTVSRDPVGGIKEGILVVDNILDSIAQVNFGILKIPGGAKNLANRTAMETTHTGVCGGDVRVSNLVSTWPPLRIDMVIDDTGSMGNELSGVKSALSSFISSQGSDLEKVQRGVSYELISFKDSPSLRLSNTEDTDAAIASVNSLFPSGGNDCPEASISALNLALSRMTGDEDSEGQIVLVTDASPRSGSIDGLIAQAQSEGIKVNVMLSGDCVASLSATAASLIAPLSHTTPSARTIFKRIAEETGGLYYYVPGATVDDYAEIMSEILDSAVTGGDSEPPVVTVNTTPTALWPVNHKLVRIDVEVTAIDNLDLNPVISFESVVSTEASNANGDGNTGNDIVINEAGEIFVRAERSGSGEGRFYTITYRATDNSGNVGFGSADIAVPHNNSQR